MTIERFKARRVGRALLVDFPATGGGATGPTGAAGAAGATGPTGATGATGAAGSAVSAYFTGGSGQAALSAGSTNYVGIADVLSTESSVQFMIPVSGTISNLFVNLTTGNPGAASSGKSYTFTLRISGADSALTCTVSETATFASDTTHTASVSGGNLLALKSVPANTPNGLRCTFGFTISP